MIRELFRHRVPKLMALLMAMIAMKSVTPLFAYDFEADGICYNITDNEAEVTYYSQTESNREYYKGHVSIPQIVSHDGTDYPVTSIGWNAFVHCASLTSVTIPNSIDTIMDGAFAYCASLTSVSIPNSVISIGMDAFRECTSLTVVSLPASVTTIGPRAFYGCTSLSSVMLPASVTAIEGRSFEGCTSLSDIYVDSSNTCYSDYDGVLFDKEKTQLITYPEGKKDTSYTIPNTVTTIGERAFYNAKSLVSVDIPQSVTKIEDGAFKGCKFLASVVIPESVEMCGRGLFEQCRSLTSVAIKCKDSAIPTGAGYFPDCFRGCISLTNVEINTDSFYDVDGIIFKGNAIIFYPAGRKEKDYVIPESVKSIQESAFSGCIYLTSVTFPETESIFSLIGESAFSDCVSLTSVILPPKVRLFRSSVFRGCISLQSVKIPALSTIGRNAFQHCKSLSSVDFSESLKSIDVGAFYYCTSLNAITLPESTTSLSGGAFVGCKSLSSVTCKATTPPELLTDGNLIGMAFDRISPNAILYVPAGCVEAYKSSDWRRYFSTIEEQWDGVCDTPVITLQDNQLVVTCETEGAKIYTTVSADDETSMTLKSGEAITLTGRNRVEAYAMRNSESKSDVATAVFVWAKPVSDEDVNMGTERALLLRSVGSNIEITGTVANECIEVYNMSGQQLYSGVADESATLIPVVLNRGEAYTVKIGKQSINYSL